ncbi:MAG: energy transducer TonB [Alistipes senegalensis]
MGRGVVLREPERQGARDRDHRFSDPDFAFQIQRTIASSPLWTPADSSGKRRGTDFKRRFDLSLQRGPNGLYSEDMTAYTDADSLPRSCGGSPGMFREWVRRQVDSLLDPGAAVPRVRVNVRFVIEPDGTMTGIRVSAPKEHSGFAKLVRMAVDKTPLWTPAVAGGEKVRFRISQILLFGQEELGKNPDSLDVLPKFQNGGLPEFRRWVMETVKFPREALESGVEGRVLASFVVEADGSVGSVRIIRSPIRCRRRWRVAPMDPRQPDGEPVRVKYTVPVDFRIPAERKTASGPAQERNTTRR